MNTVVAAFKICLKIGFYLVGALTVRCKLFVKKLYGLGRGIHRSGNVYLFKKQSREYPVYLFGVLGGNNIHSPVVVAVVGEGIENHIGIIGIGRKHTVSVHRKPPESHRDKFGFKKIVYRNVYGFKML